MGDAGASVLWGERWKLAALLFLHPFSLIKQIRNEICEDKKKTDYLRLLTISIGLCLTTSISLKVQQKNPSPLPCLCPPPQFFLCLYAYEYSTEHFVIVVSMEGARCVVDLAYLNFKAEISKAVSKWLGCSSQFTLKLMGIEHLDPLDSFEQLSLNIFHHVYHILAKGMA